MVSSVKYLGHIIDANGLHPAPDKLKMYLHHKMLQRLGLFRPINLLQICNPSTTLQVIV